MPTPKKPFEKNCSRLCSIITGVLVYFEWPFSSHIWIIILSVALQIVYNAGVDSYKGCTYLSRQLYITNVSLFSSIFKHMHTEHASYSCKLHAAELLND